MEDPLICRPLRVDSGRGPERESTCLGETDYRVVEWSSSRVITDQLLEMFPGRRGGVKSFWNFTGGGSKSRRTDSGNNVHIVSSRGRVRTKETRVVHN